MQTDPTVFAQKEIVDQLFKKSVLTSRLVCVKGKFQFEENRLIFG